MIPILLVLKEKEKKRFRLILIDFNQIFSDGLLFRRLFE